MYFEVCIYSCNNQGIRSRHLRRIMCNLSEHERNAFGYQFEHLASRLLTCRQCNTKLEHVDKSWVDLRCPCCDLKVEVKTSLKKHKHVRLSCGSSYQYDNIVSPHYLMVFQYKPLDTNGRVLIRRAKLFDLCDSSAIQSEQFEHRYRGGTRLRTYLDVDMQSHQGVTILKDNTVCRLVKNVSF